MGRSLLFRSNTIRRGLAAVLVLAGCVQSGCRAEQPWPLWESYAAKFIDGQGRVIDHAAGDKTTTEGQAYAMFFALVANDRSRFDKLLDWTENNLAQGDLTARLPSWSWGKADDGAWRVLDTHPAADADLWMAYALCEAGRLWKYPRYEKLGEMMAARVAQQEVLLVPGLGTTMLPGAEGFHPDAQTWFINASYMPPHLLAYFAKRQPASPWRDALRSLPTLVRTNGGFAMDWMAAGPAGVRPSLNPGEVAKGNKTSPPVGSYDAIRVYLWAGIADQHTPGVREIVDAMRGMGNYLRGQPLPPLYVDANGRVLSSDGPPGFSAAVIPYLHALNLSHEEHVQADRLVAVKDAKSGLYGKDGMYYDQNLVMFSSGWSEGRYRLEADGHLHTKWK